MQCIEQNQNDWFVRTRFEINHYHQIGGTVVFPTLTYRNEDLPYFDKHLKYASDIYGNKLMVFNRKHVQLFIKKLRVYLYRHFERFYKLQLSYKPNKLELQDIKNKAFQNIQGIKYICCSEYGSDPKKTQRPHYHCLIFIPFDIDSYFLKSILDKSWIYGFVGQSKKGLVVKSEACARYVSKYVSKDLGFYNRYPINDLIRRLKKHDEELAKELKRCCPFHLQSMGFGSPFFDEYNLIDENGAYQLQDILFKNQLYFKNNTSDELNQSYFTIPNYYKDKLLYNIIDGVRYPSKLAKEYYSKMYDIQLKLMEDKLTKKLSYLNLNTYPQHVLDKVGFTPFSLYKYINDTFKNNNITITDIAKYLLVFRNIHYLDTGTLDVYHLLDDSKNYYLRSKLIGLDSLDLLPDKISNYNKYQFYLDNRYSFNSFQLFCDIECIISIIEKLDLTFGPQRDEYLKEQYKKIRDERHKYNFSIYNHI